MRCMVKWFNGVHVTLVTHPLTISFPGKDIAKACGISAVKTGVLCKDKPVVDGITTIRFLGVKDKVHLSPDIPKSQIIVGRYLGVERYLWIERQTHHVDIV